MYGGWLLRNKRENEKFFIIMSFTYFFYFNLNILFLKSFLFFSLPDNDDEDVELIPE